MPEWIIRLIETPEEMVAVQELQRLVWPGSETEVIPAHTLLAVVHNGGLLLGAFVNEKLVGAAWGFPGFYSTPDGPRLKHCSHILAVHPEWRDSGLGFGLKRSCVALCRRVSPLQRVLARLARLLPELFNRLAVLLNARAVLLPAIRIFGNSSAGPRITCHSCAVLSWN